VRPITMVNLFSALLATFAVLRVWKWRSQAGALWLICFSAGVIMLNAWFDFLDMSDPHRASQNSPDLSNRKI